MEKEAYEYYVEQCTLTNKTPISYQKFILSVTFDACLEDETMF